MKRGSYTIDVDKNRNYYNCREFGHITRNCRNQKIVRQGRRVEYRDNQNTMDYLKEEESLVVFN